MSKLVDETDKRGWAELREDASGKSVTMRVLPWDDYVVLTSAVDTLIEVGRAALAYREGFMARNAHRILEGEHDFVYHNRLGKELDEALHALPAELIEGL